jgi:hypothetical protein
LGRSEVVDADIVTGTTGAVRLACSPSPALGRNQASVFSLDDEYPATA